MSDRHPSLKVEEKEVQKVAEEFLAPFKEIVESRRRLQETEMELRGLITQLSQKMDTFAELKMENLKIEHEVLMKLNRHPELNR